MDPEIQKILGEFNKSASLVIADPENEREALLRFSLFNSGKRLSTRRIEDISIQIHNHQYNIRIFKSRLDSRQPCFLYFPSGGWIRAGLNTHDNLCRYYSNLIGCTVVLAELRLAPENKFPACIEDGINIYEWLVENYADDAINIDPSQIGVGGDSAGGNIAAVVVNQLRHRQVTQPIYQFLAYPVIDLRCAGKSYETYGEGYFATTIRMKGYVEQYLNNLDEVINPMASPIFEANLARLPKTDIIVGKYDPMIDECEAYHRKLLEARVDSSFKCYENFIHAFLLMTKIPSVQKALEEVCERAKSVLFGF